MHRPAPGLLQAAALGAAVVAWITAALVPALAPLHAQLALMIAVVACSVAFGLAAGLASATLGFALLLWRSFRSVGGAPSLSLEAIVDAVLWFAVAKMLAALIAVLRARLQEAAAARAAAEAEARRFSLREEELSHRFNNDMQMLVGLLRSEAAVEPLAALPLQRAAGRLQVVGRVHRRLLGSGGTTEVNIRDFLGELVADMRAAMDQARPIAITLDAEPHLVPARTASDVGLAANELVTNALKYAFPGDREGVVRISFAQGEDGMFLLSVSDNGVGMGRGSGGRQGGLGMRLLRALAAQLGGRLELRSGEVGGTVSLLRFPRASPTGRTRDLPVAAPQPEDEAAEPPVRTRAQR
jgi:two-component sensor histidine kinase